MGVCLCVCVVVCACGCVRGCVCMRVLGSPCDGTAYAYVGGGIAALVSMDAQPPSATCPDPVTYWRYSHSTTVAVRSSLISDNSACFGGGMHVGEGGLWTLSNVSLVGNVASTAGSSWFGAGSTCSLAMSDCTVLGSNASLGTSLIEFQCGDDITLEGGHVTAVGASQVSVPPILCSSFCGVVCHQQCCV
jgi:hypothetical protein